MPPPGQSSAEEGEGRNAPRPHGTFFPDVQGLRGVAVLAVVLYHAVGAPISGGYVGVDVFFVISGYLITGLLVREHARRGRVDLLAFYARRARRLLPAAALAILATLVVSWLTLGPFESVPIARSALAATFYVSNVAFASRAVDYLNGNIRTDPLLHTWSLGVEEQFYLVWPLLIVAAGFVAARLGRRRPPLVPTFLAVIGASFLACVYVTAHNQPAAFFGMATRAWEFGLGSIALLVFGRGFPGGRRVNAALAWAGAGLLAVAILRFDEHTTFPGAAALLPALGAAMLIVAGRATRPPVCSRLLGIWPLQRLGDVSYSWYLWHWPAIVLTGALFGASPRSIALAAGLSLVAAILSYRLVENPIRYHRRLIRRPGLSLAAAAVLALASGAVAGVVGAEARTEAQGLDQAAYEAARSDLPEVYADGCHADFFRTVPLDCTFCATDAPGAIALFGDSHAAQWFPALERIAEARHVRLVSVTKSSCPASAIPIYNEQLRRTYTECSEWRGHALERLVALKPAVVVVSGYVGYEEPAANGGSPVPVSPAHWALGLESVLTPLRAAGIPVVLLHDTPKPTEDIPVCLSRAAHRRGDARAACRFTTAEARHPAFADAEASVAGQSPINWFVDPTSLVCPAATCEVERDGYVLFRDADHITATFSRVLAPPLDRALAAVAPGAPLPMRTLFGTPWQEHRR